MDPAVTRVAFVSSHGQLGGSELYLLRLLDRLGPEWVESVTSLEDGPFVGRMRAAGHPVVVLPTSARAAGIATTAARLRRRLPADVVVHANGVKAALVASLATVGSRTPVVWVKHDFSWGGPLTWLLARRCRRVVAVSNAVAAGLDPRRVVVIPTGVSTPRVERRAARAALPVPPGVGPVVSVIGRFHPVKGHLELVEALPALRGQVPTVHALLVGDDDPHVPDLRSEVLRRAAELGVSEVVTVLGHRDDALHLMAGSDVVVVPTVADGRAGREGFGLVAAEAMSVGTPVVAYDHGAVPEVLGGCGELVAPGDRAALAAALARLLDDEERRERLAACGRHAVATRLDPEVMVTAMKACYRAAEAS